MSATELFLTLAAIEQDRSLTPAARLAARLDAELQLAAAEGVTVEMQRLLLSSRVAA